MSYFNKTSLLIPSQLPEYIRDDPSYSNFVTFLQAYYEWAEQKGGFVYESKNLLNYHDIDTTLDEFINYYINEFMSSFPEGSLSDKRNLIKIIKEIYQTKGTPNSYKFLFRTLFNSESETYNSKDFVLKASDGKWVVTKYITINSTDPVWKQSIGYRIFGLSSKSYATIENIVLNEDNINVIITGLVKNFTAGELVKVVNNNFDPVQFSSGELIAQSYGIISSVILDKNNKGVGYSVGDPVVFYGGLNPSVENPVGASAYISDVTLSSITDANIIKKGYGYRPGGYTTINVTSSSGGGNGASIIATTFDTYNNYLIDYVPTDILDGKWNTLIGSNNYIFANLINANVNTKLSDAFTHPQLNTFGILKTTVVNEGSEYDDTVYATATGYYSTEIGSHSTSQQPLGSLSNLGILEPITIEEGGLGYTTNDIITISGGNGYGAYANIVSVAANGSIESVVYVPYLPKSNNLYPLGGMGYTNGDMPVVSVSSANGFGAILTISGIVGYDAKFDLPKTPYGQIQKITVTNAGRDYITAPSVSLRVSDLLVNHVDDNIIPVQGDKIYQNNINQPTFIANVANITLYESNTIPLFSNYNLRVFNYDGIINVNQPLYILRNNSEIASNIHIANVTTGIYTNGIKQYGNGVAKAHVDFSNSVLTSDGIYVNQDGHPSAYSVLEDNNYNNFTYILQVHKELIKYKNNVIKFLHPSGLKYRSVDIIKNSNTFIPSVITHTLINQSLGYLLSVNDYKANTVTNSNVVTFSNLSGSNVANVVNVGSFLTYDTPHNYPFYSKITDVTSNTITLQDNWVTLVPNVAIATVSNNSSIINIINLTDAWNIATGNIVSHISNFINTNDHISFDNGVTYKSVTHVDEYGLGNSIFVDSEYTSNQSGYITLSKNVNSSRIYISGYIPEVQTINLLTENEIPLITEDNKILLLG